MDEHLRRLQRKAAETGNHTKYNTALARAGQKRIVIRRLTIAEFAARTFNPNPLRIYVTDWSDNNHFTAGDRGVGFIFEVTGQNILIGDVIKKDKWIRILEIEYKTLIINQDWLVHPKKLNVKHHGTQKDLTIIRAPKNEGIDSYLVSYFYIDINDEVKLDQEIFELEADKANIAFPAPVAGKVVEIYVNLGATIKPGDAILAIDKQN